MRLISCILTAAMAAQAPSVAVFETETWPGEGRPHFLAITHEIVIRESPSSNATIIRRLPVRTGQSVAFDQTRFRTMVPGSIQVLAAGTVTGRVIGTTRLLLTREAYYKGKFPQGTAEVQPGDAIEYLQYRAEGTCFVRVDGRILDATPCPSENERRFRVVSQPATEWWIRVVVDGEPIGWLLVEDETVKLSRRSF